MTDYLIGEKWGMTCDTRHTVCLSFTMYYKLQFPLEKSFLILSLKNVIEKNWWLINESDFRIFIVSVAFCSNIFDITQQQQ